MDRAAKWALLVGLGLGPVGCGGAKLPFENDPLMRHGQVVSGDHARARTFAVGADQEPLPPQPPRPVTLPTLEWEEPRTDLSRVPATWPLAE
jgi:hypothetical protein